MAAISKTLLALLLMFFLVLQFVHSVDIVAKSNGSEQSLSKKINCGALCSRRCKLSGRPNLCRRACGTCCSRCKCVPPGTYGNYHVCPCYAKLTTRGGKHKCP